MSDRGPGSSPDLATTIALLLLGMAAGVMWREIWGLVKEWL